MNADQVADLKFTHSQSSDNYFLNERGGVKVRSGTKQLSQIVDAKQQNSKSVTELSVSEYWSN